MRKSRIGRTAVGLLAACVLLSACGGSGGDAESQPDAKGAAGTTGVSGKADVFVQMTGLLLIVPPTAGESLHVYLPKPRGLGAHVALLGFAVPDGLTLPANFCEEDSAADSVGICYVDMEKWSLDAFGREGSTPTTTAGSFPSVDSSGLVNVTELSGGDYRAFPKRAHAKSQRRLTFLSGSLANNQACKLAEWRVRRVNQQGQPQSAERDSLSNVVVWAMPGVDTAHAKLTFRRGNDSVQIPLPSGETRLLLAHIPTDDRKHLPPGSASTVDTSSVADFHPFYDLLSKSNTETDSMPHAAPHRSVPDSASGGSTPCAVRVETGNKRTGETRSMATYACIPAWGGG